MSDARVRYLVTRFFDGSITSMEKEELAAWVEQAGDDDALKKVLEEAWDHYEPDAELRQDADPALNRIIGNLFLPEEPKPRFRFIKRFAAAAAVALVAGAGIYYLYKPSGGHQPVAAANIANDVMPGGAKAVLTLSNGQQIVLDDAADGVLAQQGGTSISKQAGGQIVYDASGDASREILYNTMSTPKGGEYQLTLPDGTKAWLNAASSITYPTAFAGRERIVRVSGEVYLEVAKNKDKPFRVQAGDVQLEVLGTHFNVNAYGDDKTVSTTLLEGSVKVNAAGNSRVITPGQQAKVAQGGKMTVDANVNIAETMAWKNGRFVFEGASIETVMRQLSRWYDVEVKALENVDDLFFVDVPRNKKISDVLKALELTGKVKFRIEGKTIMILK
ncbi:FecR family protein [Chitinophaga sp. GCM10012297]|uniref:FecR domain-containing protein n=1 Tax=Chitinophaga chungangae TaxID=2821488 RepID=A0ABS3YCB1_9BACT|nr:FecR family protein [Chitinophaga chungangae]MBO9152296.1 FecR domain-containing protein [Chitinophaga chungangae]